MNSPSHVPPRPPHRPHAAPAALTDPVHEHLRSLVADMCLEQKVLLLTGQDFWTTRALPAIGLRPLTLSDGPCGVRGPLWDERLTSLNLPSATVLASTWDRGMARAYGRVLACEARRRGVDVVLAPTLNIHRSPHSGRNFECLSEDPHLTAGLGASLIVGMQELGVAASPKHFVANDYETQRFTASSEVSARALREVYLLPFEAAVEVGAWALMSSYNSINGIPSSEHPLLTTPLKADWDFDGVVVSDWAGVRTVEAAAGGQDLVMPGPAGPWGRALVEAVTAGDIAESAVDDKVLRLLLLAQRVGALPAAPGACASDDDEPQDGTPDVQAAGLPDGLVDGQRFARQVAADGTVLLTNDGILPLDPTALTSIAVIGENASRARTQGGGSATVLPARQTSPLDGIREAMAQAAEAAEAGGPVTVGYALGAEVQKGVQGLPLSEMTNPDTGLPGVRVDFLDDTGAVIFAEDRLSCDLVWFGGDAPTALATTLRLRTRWTPSATHRTRLGFAASGLGEVHVDGQLLTQGAGAATGRTLGASPLLPPSVVATFEATEATVYDLALNLSLDGSSRGQAGLLAVRLGTEPVPSDPDQLIAEATELARSCEVAVVVVGTNADVEAEGFDRTTLALPGEPARLVRSVAETGTPTIVVVNAGAPVLMPWSSQVAAIVVPYFGGQEMGGALADVLLGHQEPGGRLPTTWPRHEEDLPVGRPDPLDGLLHYGEGIHVGYRGWLRNGAEPAFVFGSGLGYTSWALAHLSVSDPSQAGEPATLELRVTNTGARPGKEVVQIYLSRPRSSVERPVRWLAQYQPVRLSPGQSTNIEVPIPWRTFCHWDGEGWVGEPGQFEVHVGTSAEALPLTSTILISPTR